MRAFLIAALTALSALFMPAVASAQEAPDALVKRVTDEVLQILRNEPNLKAGDTGRVIPLVEKAVLPHFNFRRMTSLAVGRDWRQATPDQQQRLTDGFYSLLVRTYSNALTEYRDQAVNIRPLRMAAGDKTVRVQTEIIQSGRQPITVDYMLENGKDGWKVFDIVIAGASLVTNYRSTFAEEINRGGIDGLIASLENRTIQVPPAKS